MVVLETKAEVFAESQQLIYGTMVQLGGYTMSLVEKKYNEALNKMSGRQRVERTVSLFGPLCEVLALQIAREHGQLSDRETRKKIAERLYLSDKGALALLQKVRVN